MASEAHDRTGWRTSLLTMLLVLAVWMTSLQIPALWRVTGIGQTGVPFLDLYALLAAGEVAQAHGDPFQPNPLDVFHRPHVYTTWWLVSSLWFGLTRADTEWIGLTMAVLSACAAVALVRPRQAKETVQTALVLCSPAVLMGVYRGNNDLVVLIILCGALACLRAAGRGLRLAGVALLALAAVSKYYPLAAVLLLLGARTRRELLAAIAGFALVLLVAWPGLKPGLASAARFKPHPEGLFAFGAPSVFRDFGVESSTGWIALAALMGALVLWLTRGQWRTAPATTVDSADEREFICSAALLAGVFFLGASYVYKLVFAVWLLPLLWRGTPSAGDARWRRVLWWSLLGVLWLEGVMAVLINLVIMPLSLPLAYRLVDATMVAGQLLGWALVTCLVRELALYGIRHVRRLSPAAA